MIYSQWDPTSGRYNYFETAEVNGLNDDLPRPFMPATRSPIGVAAIACGRDIPQGARHVGQGDAARGVIARPASVAVHGQLMGGDSASSMLHVQHILLGIAIGVAGTFIWVRYLR